MAIEVRIDPTRRGNLAIESPPRFWMPCRGGARHGEPTPHAATGDSPALPACSDRSHLAIKAFGRDPFACPKVIISFIEPSAKKKKRNLYVLRSIQICTGFERKAGTRSSSELSSRAEIHDPSSIDASSVCLFIYSRPCMQITYVDAVNLGCVCLSL